MSKPIGIFSNPRSVTSVAGLATALAVAGGTGCVAAGDPLDVGAIQQAAITWNGLEFALVNDEYTVQAQPWRPWIRLADGKLVDLQNDPLICTGEGPHIFSYVVKCALKENVKLNIDCSEFSGRQVQFLGALGLAPNWATTPLPQSGQERLRITACLAAHYNDVSVQISLRGLGLSVSTQQQESSLFNVLEGAFWGNLFDSAQPEVHVCSDTNYVATQPQSRDCTTGITQSSNPCGFIPHTPNCQSVSVCNQSILTGGSFSMCSGSSSVLTTYLQPWP